MSTHKINCTGTFLGYTPDGFVDATILKNDGAGKLFNCESVFFDAKPFQLADVKPGDKFSMETEFDASTVYLKRVTKL